MENMDKGLTVPKWVLINWPKMPQNLSSHIVCPSPNVWNFEEKRLYCASVVLVNKLVFHTSLLNSHQKKSSKCCTIFLIFIFLFTCITGCSSRWWWFIVNRWRFVILRGRFIIHCRWRFITNNRWSRWCSLLRLDARWRWWWFSEKRKQIFYNV